MTLHEAAARITALEALLKHLFAEIAITPWTAVDAIEIPAENAMVCTALVECIGKDFTVIKFSRFLNQNCGLWGEYLLRRTEQHSRDGAVFSVTKPGQSVTTHESRHATPEMRMHEEYEQ
jgi:hypothetical protein